MTMFSYRARDPNGVLVTGQLDAPSVHLIRDFLSDQGLIPIQINKISSLFFEGLSVEGIKQSVKNWANKIKPAELMLFTMQFYTLFKAGMNMESILSTLALQTNNKYFGDVISRIKTDVASGSSLSQAFAKHPNIFNELYINMIATGEEAGILEGVLEKVSKLMEKDMKLQSSIKSAMMYPKIIMVAIGIATFILMRFVIPKFKELYDSFDAELPLPTRIMIGASDIAVTWTIPVLLLGVVGFFLFNKGAATPNGRLKVDRFKLKLPIFGDLAIKVSNARFAHILGALYKAGLPVIRGLTIAAKTIGNEAFTREVMVVQNEVEKGRSISDSMRGTKYFNPLLIEATAVGEKTGALDDMYEAIGNHYDMEVDQMVENLSTLIEPILLFFIAVIVGIFALAILLPMWNLANVVH